MHLKQVVRSARSATTSSCRLLLLRSLRLLCLHHELGCGAVLHIAIGVVHVLHRLLLLADTVVGISGAFDTLSRVLCKKLALVRVFHAGHERGVIGIM